MRQLFEMRRLGGKEEGRVGWGRGGEAEEGKGAAVDSSLPVEEIRGLHPA